MRQVGEGPHFHTISLATAACLPSSPSLISSSCIRGAPQRAGGAHLSNKFRTGPTRRPSPPRKRNYGCEAEIEQGEHPGRSIVENQAVNPVADEIRGVGWR